MYLLENALFNVLKNRGRNLLIGAIIFAVIVTTVIALMINSTADGVIDDYKGRFSSEVQIQPNMQKVREEAMASREANGGRVMLTTPTLNADQYIAFGQSEYLANAVYTAQTGVNSETITPIDADKGPGSGQRGTIMGGGGGGSSMPQYYFKLMGGQFGEFKDGTRALTDGSAFPDKLNECLVGEELAEANGIKIGDTLSLTGSLFKIGDVNSETGSPDITTEDVKYTLKVTGIYYDMNEAYTEGGQQNAFTNRRNEILATYETVQQNFVPDYRGMAISAAYFLKEPSLLEAFEAEVRSKGLAETFDVTTDVATYEKIVGPVEGLKSIAITFMVVVLIFGGIIIALLSSIAIRERKYEIGVLRAMGMKKRKVAFGLWAEMLMITLLCLAVGFGVGRLAAQPVTNALLAGQIRAAEAAEQQQQQPMGGMMIQMQSATNATDAEPLSNIDISLGMDTALEITGIALLLATLAALIAISRITKYEPIKILMERN